MTTVDYLRFLAALMAVLAAIGLLAWLARRFRLGGLAGSTMRSGRLEIVETLSIDGRQRLLLIRRDDREHLLLMGPERSMVVETSISPSKQSPGAETSLELAASSS